MLDILAGSLNYKTRRVNINGLFPSEEEARAYLEFREDTAADMFLDSVYFMMKLNGKPYFRGEASAWTRGADTRIYIIGEEREGRLEDYIWADDAERLIRDAYAELSKEGV